MPKLETASIPVAVFSSVLLLTGCATQKPAEPDPRLGEVAARALEPSADDAYRQAKEGERYSGAEASEANISPQYPGQLLARNLPPVKVKIRLVVDESGNVIETTSLDPDTGDDPAFFVAVQATVRTWKFSPLVKTERDPGKASFTFPGLAESFQGKDTALPFHQDYEFTFTQRDGKGMVSTSKDRS